VSVILIAFPYNAERNSRKIESEKLEIEPVMKKPTVFDSFEINCIWSSNGEPEWERFLGSGVE
jgi:hypothetical protein